MWRSAKARGERVTVEAQDGAECYAFPHKRGRIVWGVNEAVMTTEAIMLIMNILLRYFSAFE